MEVVYHPMVPGEVRDIIEYYEGISQLLGDQCWEEIQEAVADIRENPKRHHFDQSGRRRRNLKKFPFHILFRVMEDHIRVTAVRHHRRDPGYGSRRG